MMSDLYIHLIYYASYKFTYILHIKSVQMGRVYQCVILNIIYILIGQGTVNNHMDQIY